MQVASSPWKTFAYSRVSAFLLCAGLVETSSDQTGVVFKDGSAVAGRAAQRFSRIGGSFGCRRSRRRPEKTRTSGLVMLSAASLESELGTLRKVAKHGERV